MDPLAASLLPPCRVSIPLSILDPPHRYRIHRRKSFDASDTLALPRVSCPAGRGWSWARSPGPQGDPGAQRVRLGTRRASTRVSRVQAGLLPSPVTVLAPFSSPPPPHHFQKRLPAARIAHTNLTD